MTRQILDDYLDDTLDAGQRVEVERRLGADRAMADLHGRMKRERALRAAALASYEPTAEEAGEVAARILAAMEGPARIGYVGMWARRLAGVAAVLALIVGSFVAGRTTAPNVDLSRGTVAVIYRVMYFADSGEVQVREFADLDGANEFMKKLDVARSEPQLVQAVDLTKPGSF